MSLWWQWGTYEETAGTDELNAPSLWSGGVAWGTAVAYQRGYWQSSALPTDRTGVPDLSIAVGGAFVTNDIRSATWDLGRSGWFDTLRPSSASLEFEGAVTAEVMDTVVIGVMSDTTNEHSDPLWVGFVDTINETTEASGRVTTSVSCIDFIGRLGQSDVPASFSVSNFNLPIGDLIEAIAAEVGTPITVVDDSVLAPGVGTPFGFEDGETVLGFLNRLEGADNLALFARGDGRLVIQRRWYDADPEYDPVQTAVVLEDADAPATWTTQLSATSVYNEFSVDTIGEPTTAMLESRDTYGKRSYDLPEESNGWGILVDTGLLNDPRRTLTSASVRVTDLGHALLFIDPNDWVELDGTTYQVLSVRHSVSPGRTHDWSVEITGDSTQPLLREEFV